MCNVSSIPRSDFSWSRNGVVVEADDRVTVDESGSLVVSSVELTDAGVYVCNASNLEGFVVSLSATITVEGMGVYCTHARAHTHTHTHTNTDTIHTHTHTHTHTYIYIYIYILLSLITYFYF